MGQSNSFVNPLSLNFVIFSTAYAQTSDMFGMFTNPAPGAEVYKYATICFIALLVYLAFS